MDLNTCVVASPSRIINLESFKMYFMYNKIIVDRSFVNFKCTFLYEIYLFIFSKRWSVHLISMKGLVVYVLKK
jgi:hypothetical protein